MLQLFMADYVGERHAKQNLPYINVKKKQIAQFDKTIQYFREVDSYIPNTNVLVKLINSSYIDHLSVDAFEYLRISTEKAKQIARMLDFGSMSILGRFKESVAYREGVEEYVIYDYPFINPFDVEKEWMTLCPLDVLYSTDDNTTPTPIQDRLGDSYSDFAIYYLNLPMMMMMYREYVKSGGSSTKSFVTQYVLNNMMVKLHDITMVNRYIAIATDAPRINYTINLPISVSNQQKNTDRALSKIIRQVRLSGSYRSAMDTMPTTFSSTANEVLALPSIALTRNTTWALVLSRVYIMKFLTEFKGGVLNKQGRGNLNAFKYTTDRLLRGTVMEQVIPEEIRDRFNNAIEEIRER